MSDLGERQNEISSASAGLPEDVVSELYDLNVGVVGQGDQRHERPHKPVLLLAALDLIDRGKDRPDCIRWSRELRSTFKRYFDLVRSRDDSDTPENPFLYLRGDGIWRPYYRTGNSVIALDHTPTVGEANDGLVYATLAGGVEIQTSTSAGRARVRDALVSRYFPHARISLAALYGEVDPETRAETAARKEDFSEPDFTGRNPAFRRKVLEVYDWQCAACGLRIKLPDSQLTFVDGAHLIPFSVGRNDHPTNGIALCKNHHWAMDRFLIVPTTDGRWKVSRVLDPRRSPGEQQLCSLEGQPLLPPHDDAYRPAMDALKWRADRLISG